MRSKVSAGEYLAFLSTKYEVDPDKLFHALVSAASNRSASCGDLTIECRRGQQGKTVLLLTKGQRVVAQFPVPNEFLLEESNPIRDFRGTGMLRRSPVARSSEPRSVFIKDLRTGMKKVTLRAKVLEIAEPTLVFTRFGNYASVANALIADETGAVKLCLWNEQISSVSVGDVIDVKNASISMFRGEKQLRIGRKGTVDSVRDLALSQNGECKNQVQ